MIKHTEDEFLIITYVGNLDLSSLDEFEIQFREASGSRKNIILDFSQCGHIDSAGVGLLIRLYHRIDGGLAIANCPKLKKMLLVSGLSRTFDIYSDIAEAKASLRELH